jgi:hypothetical protein
MVRAKQHKHVQWNVHACADLKGGQLLQEKMWSVHAIQ